MTNQIWKRSVHNYPFDLVFTSQEQKCQCTLKTQILGVNDAPHGVELFPGWKNVHI